MSQASEADLNVDQGGKQTVLIVGATSGIARSVAAELAADGYALILAGRDLLGLRELAAKLTASHGAEIRCEAFDAREFDQHETLVHKCWSKQLVGVVVCHGLLPNPKTIHTNWREIENAVAVNLTSLITLLEPLAARMAERQSGWIAAVSSVAGERGRQSNYIYGCTKAGVSTYLQGLRNRLFASNVHVLTIKPGYVDTKMIAGRFKPGALLVASPDRVARDIVRAIHKRRNVIYTPWFWRYIVLIMRLLPEVIFKRLST